MHSTTGYRRRRRRLNGPHGAGVGSGGYEPHAPWEAGVSEAVIVKEALAAQSLAVVPRLGIAMVVERPAG